ncbi:MAG: prepilin-type N-terminal cleavage/methylation domain-containing protein [Endomicrobia bacterium]|nr:prepilin-type N-terminal cleavage/methylation domain-containing protein [Endomicrobiia bacterium]
MRKSSGVTILELILALVVLGILAVMTGVVYRNYVTKAKIAEGIALVNELKIHEELHFASRPGNSYESVNKTDYYDQFANKDIVDARANKYFKEFAVKTSGDGYIAEAYYEYGGSKGVTVSLTASADGAYTITTKSNE